ncbi:2011_t:CDS:1, partial [Racocetra persica]
TAKSHSALFMNANWPVLGGSSLSAQTSQYIVWMNKCRCQSKALYEDTNNECIQNDKTGRSENIYNK